MEMLAAVRRALQRAAQLPEVRIALHPSLGAAQLPRLQGIASKLGAEVLQDAGAPPLFSSPAPPNQPCRMSWQGNTCARTACDKHVRTLGQILMRG